MNYQIADAKTRYFNDKQHYLNFLQAWKKAAQRSASKGDDRGCLTGAHVVFYALLRGRDVRTAFTPITKKIKLSNGAYINHGMYWAAQELRGVANINGWNHEERIKKFLAPFNETVTEEMLTQLYEDMPDIPALYSNYGKGIKIAEALIDADNKDVKNLWKIIEEGEA